MCVFIQRGSKRLNFFINANAPSPSLKVRERPGWWWRNAESRAATILPGTFCSPRDERRCFLAAERAEKYKTTLLRIGTCHSINLSAADGAAGCCEPPSLYLPLFSLFLSSFRALSSLSLSVCLSLFLSFTLCGSLPLPLSLALAPSLSLSLSLRTHRQSRRANIPNRERVHVRPYRDFFLR